MRRNVRATVVVLSAAVVMTAGSVAAWGQSVTRTPPPGSQQSPEEKLELALEGYSPVSIKDARKWVKGNSEHRAAYDGRAYHFTSPVEREKFVENPGKYVPVLRGDCVVSLVKMGKRAPGHVRHRAFHQGRLFLFANEQAKKMFVADPGTFADADLALGGQCPVCLIEMNEKVQGKPELTVHYKGLRYFFPSVKQQGMFLANPRKYKQDIVGKEEPPKGSEKRVPPI